MCISTSNVVPLDTPRLYIECAHYFQTSLQCPTATRNLAHLLEGEGTKVYASFARPDAETSVIVLVEPFQLGSLQMMCWVTRCIDHTAHIMNQEFVFEVPSGAC